MTHYYDYYNHKFNSPDSFNPYKAPPEKYEPSKAGKGENLYGKNCESNINGKGDVDNGKTNPQ